MQKTFLVIDPAFHSAYALVRADYGTNSADIYHYEVIDIDTSSEYNGDWCNDMFQKVSELIVQHDIDHICVEDYYFSSKFASGGNINPMYRAAIHMAARKLNKPYHVLNISQWKSFVAGRSVPTKEQKKKYGAEAAKKLFIQQALFEKYGIRFPNFSLSPTTGKPIIFRTDVVDVVAQAICFCRLHMNLNNVTCSVPVPQDIVFKKKIKKQYTYPT